MCKYNDSRHRLGRWVWPCLLLLAACASTGEPATKVPTPQAHKPPTSPQRAPHRSATQYQPQEPAAAASPVLRRSDLPLRYVVKKGDTLWDIAAYFLADPWYWPELWYSNPQIENPHLIYPGQVLELVWVDGRPRLRRAPARTQRLSPRVREQPLPDAIPTIPIASIRQFLNGPRFVTAEELDQAPYVVTFLDERLLGSANDEAYVRHADPASGDAYALVRPGQVYHDPDTGEILGYEAIPVATIRITKFGDISTGLLTASRREAKPGDRLLPIQDAVALASDFYPHPPATPVQGHVIAVFDGLAHIGQYQIVTLDLGATDGMERGHVLAVFRTGRSARDPLTDEVLALPPLKVGTLMVFQVEPRVCFALVMRATRSIRILDSVRNPQP